MRSPSQVRAQTLRKNTWKDAVHVVLFEWAKWFFLLKTFLCRCWKLRMKVYFVRVYLHTTKEKCRTADPGRAWWEVTSRFGLCWWWGRQIRFLSVSKEKPKRNFTSKLLKYRQINPLFTSFDRQLMCKCHLALAGSRGNDYLQVHTGLLLALIASVVGKLR